jgi:hemoglobin
MVKETLFEHAGGTEGLHRLEDHFYSSVLADSLLQPLFGVGRPEHVDHLTWFTAESFGGPDRFTRELVRAPHRCPPRLEDHRRAAPALR